MNESHHKKLLASVAWLRERNRYVLDHAKNPDGNAVTWIPTPDAAKEAVARELTAGKSNVSRLPARLRRAK